MRLRKSALGSCLLGGVLAMTLASACHPAAAPSASRPLKPQAPTSHEPATVQDQPRKSVPAKAGIKDWPAIAPAGYELAATHTTGKGELWLLLRPGQPEGSHPLRVCVLSSNVRIDASFLRARCHDLPSRVPHFESRDVGFALDETPIVVGPDPHAPERRVGFSAETGAPVRVRGMAGSERHNGLTVEKLGSRRFKVMQVVNGKPRLTATLSIPDLGDWGSDNRPVIAGEQVGWFAQHEDELGWYFSGLTKKGLSPYFVGRGIAGAAECEPGVLIVPGTCCDSFSFLEKGRWSKPVRSGSSIQDAGPRFFSTYCRDGVALQVMADYALVGAHQMAVEQVRCTAGGCKTKLVQWPTPKADSVVLLAPLLDDNGTEKVAYAWQDEAGALQLKLAPIEALARTKPQVHALGRRFEKQAVVIEDSVALVVFSGRGLHLLRVDVHGNVGPLAVDTPPPTTGAR